MPQPLPAQPPAEEAEHVVHHPRRRAQSCRLEEQRALVEDIDAHQPNSRASRLIRSPPASSS